MDLHKFIENHRYGIDVTKKPSWKLLEYYPFERNFYNHILENNFTVCKKSRQMHITSMLATYVAWHMIYNKTDRKRIFYYANKFELGKRFKERVDRVLIEFGLDLSDDKNIAEKVTKTETILSEKYNNNHIIVKSCTPDNIRGYSYSDCDMVIFDECAFILNFDKIMGMLAPTIDNHSDGKGAKFVMVSTPNGIETFYGIYSKAVRGENVFKHIDLTYNMNPRFQDPKWLEEMKRLLNHNDKLIRQEIYAEFVTSDKVKKNKSNLLQFRVNDDLMNEIGLKLIEKDISISEYLRKLVEEDIAG